MFLAASILAVFVVGLALFGNWHRSQKRPTFALQNNCLLTNHPLVFVSGERSLFYFVNYWNWIPEALRNHGYEVFEIRLPWKLKARKKALLQFLKHCEDQGRKIHLVTDFTNQGILDQLQESQLTATQSISLIKAEENLGPSKIQVEDLKPKSRAYRLVELKKSDIEIRPKPIDWICLAFHCLSRTSVNIQDLFILGFASPPKNSRLFKEYLKLSIDLAEGDLTSRAE